jgi:hypothetical protein
MNKNRAIEEFFSRLRLNVVRVKAQSILTTATSNATVPVFGPGGDLGGFEGQDNLLSPGATRNALVFRLEGDGVILDGGLILCLAETVVIPPFALANLNRYPLPVSSRVPAGVMNQLVPMGLITLSIETKTECANESGILVADYSARIFAVDPANNLVLLAVDIPECDIVSEVPIDETYSEVPIVEGPRNPPLDFKKIGVCISCEPPKLGEKVYVIGSTSSNVNGGGSEPKSIHVGSVALSNYTDPSGWSLELLTQLTISGVYNNHVGSGVFNSKGRLVGLIVAAPTGTYTKGASNAPINGDYANIGNNQASLPNISNLSNTSGDGRVAMISLQAIQQFIHACRLTCDGLADSAPSDISSVAVNDAYLGVFRQITYGYFGIGYRSFSGVDYYDAQDFTGSVTGVPGSLYPRLLADGTQAPVANARPIDGIYVSSISGNVKSRPAEYQPGAADSGTGLFGPGLTDSPFATLLNPGDKILALVRGEQFYYVGSNPGEKSPNTYASLFNVGDVVQIYYSPVSSSPPYSTVALTPLVTLPARPNYAAYPYEAYPRINGFTLGLNIISVLPPSIPGFQPSF